MKDTPDYSQYSLEELREMAGRAGKQLFSRELARLMREIEKREQAQTGGEAVQAAPGCGRILLHTCGGMVLAHFVLVIVPRTVFPPSFSLPFALNPYALWAAQFIIGVVLGSSVAEPPRQGEVRYTWRRLFDEYFALLLSFLGGAGLGWAAVSAVSLGFMLSNAESAGLESFWRLAGYGGAAVGGVLGGVLSQKSEGRMQND